MEHPESEFVRRTFTIRQMDFPPEVTLTKRSLLRWFALSFGLISENESRSKVLDVLDGFFFLQLGKKVSPTTSELLSHLNSNGKRIDEKILRYHLKRMADLGIIERKKGKYCFSTSPLKDKNDVAGGFEHNIVRPINDSLKMASFSLEKLSESYSRKSEQLKT